MQYCYSTTHTYLVVILCIDHGYSFQVRPVDNKSIEPAADVSGYSTLSAPKLVFNFKRNANFNFSG